jgi:hypothetical protein
MNWIIAAAGITSATVLVAHTTQPQPQRPQDRWPQEVQPGQRVGQPGFPQPRRDIEHPLERSPDWSEAEVNRPGPNHEILEPVIGEWTALVTVYRNGQELQSRGIMRNQWVFGNRFIRGVYQGEEDETGQRRQGISFLGYNNAADRYETTWLDTTSTEIMTAFGHLEPNTRVLTLTGQYTCTMTGQDIPTRIVARMDRPDRIIWEMFENPLGQREHKTLEILYTRMHDDPGMLPGQRRPDQFPGRLPQFPGMPR